MIQFTALYFCSVWAVSAFTYCCFETPMRLGVRALLKTRKTEATDSAPSRLAIRRAA
jgi:hypothetical protein